VTDRRFFSSFAEQSPDHAGAQNTSFAMTVARNTSWSELAGSPLSRRTRSAYLQQSRTVLSTTLWNSLAVQTFSITEENLTDLDIILGYIKTREVQCYQSDD